jgi:hypothetical protein
MRLLLFIGLLFLLGCDGGGSSYGRVTAPQDRSCVERCIKENCTLGDQACYLRCQAADCTEPPPPPPSLGCYERCIAKCPPGDFKCKNKCRKKCDRPRDDDDGDSDDD